MANISHKLLTVDDEDPVHVDSFLVEDGDFRQAHTMIVRNVSDESNVYFGSISVTTTDYGYVLASGESLEFSLITNPLDLYAIADGADAFLAVLNVLMP